MNTESNLRELLRWRLARAEAEAPPAPRASRLIALTRPWWETWPEKFESIVARLIQLEVGFGHALTEPGQNRNGHPVPVLLVRTMEELETFARVLYLDVRDGGLRLRFRLENLAEAPERSFDVTFVSESTGQPLLSAAAVLSIDPEYRVDIDLPEQIAKGWERLKVTDKMPFRLILRPPVTGE
jgi:hypothetical protein